MLQDTAVFPVLFLLKLVATTELCTSVLTLAMQVY